MNNIKMIRKNKGITQRELADSMGVSFQYISQLEKEDKELTGLSINTLQKCATAEQDGSDEKGIF